MRTLHHLRDFTMLRAALLVALIGLGHMAHVWQGQERFSAVDLDVSEGAQIWRALIILDCDEDKAAEEDPLI